MSRNEVINQIQKDYIDFIKKEAQEKGLQEETIAGVTRSIWLIFKPDGSIETE